jgi:transposase
VQLARQMWREKLLGMDPRRLIFIDETWTSTNMVRSRGRSPRGRRCVGSAPHGHWKTTTFVGGLRQDGLIAPMVTDGPMDGAMFLAYTRQMLAPALQPGDIVILDNLSSHKVRGVKQAVLAAGATLLYLPPYSPDFNPIEKFFSKLKALLRKAGARTVSTLWDEIGTLRGALTKEECANYFAACQYVNT